MQRLALPSRAIEREHQLPAETLAEGMLGDQHFELADQVPVAAEREISLGPLLQCDKPPLLEARNLVLSEVFEGEVCERGPAPDVERVGQRS
jgi:hypothetical protein